MRQCETRMIYAQNEIHSVALKFTEAISQKEKALLDELHLYYGDETNEYLKKKDDLESFLEQLKSKYERCCRNEGIFGIYQKLLVLEVTT